MTNPSRHTETPRDSLSIPLITVRAVEISDQFLALLNQEEPWTAEQYRIVEGGMLS